MSRKRRKTPGGTAASLVLETLKKRNALDEASAVPVSVFKDLPLQTNTLSYTIANLIEEGIVVQTANDKYYYDDLGFKALERKFVKGYAMFFIIPIAVMLVGWAVYKYFF
jgi:hypothetical protein